MGNMKVNRGLRASGHGQVVSDKLAHGKKEKYIEPWMKLKNKEI